MTKREEGIVKSVTLLLPVWMLKALDKIKKKRETTRMGIMKQAIIDYLDKYER